MNVIMQMSNVLKSPLVSEKMSQLNEQFNRVGFIVDKRANKIEIKKAVEVMYGVKVDTVKTMILPGKSRTRNTKKGVISGKTKAYKKAIVTLTKGDSIDFFSNI